MNDLVTPTVVVVGAGFGGLRVARALRRAPVQVILVDRHNYPGKRTWSSGWSR
jgi:NADH dehydrogenase